MTLNVPLLDVPLICVASGRGAVTLESLTKVSPKPLANWTSMRCGGRAAETDACPPAHTPNFRIVPTPPLGSCRRKRDKEDERLPPTAPVVVSGSPYSIRANLNG